MIVAKARAVAKRRKDLSAWAQSRGLRFGHHKNCGMGTYYSFKCLRQGHSQYAHNISMGFIDDLEIAAFDYQYKTGHDRNQQTHTFSAVVMQSPFPLKPLFIRRESIFDKITEFFGMDDIDFESAEFSRKFFVKAPDKKWAYDVIHQRMMEYLLESPMYAIEFDSENIIVWQGKCYSPSEFDSAIEFVRGIIKRIPEYVVEQQA